MKYLMQYVLASLLALPFYIFVLLASMIAFVQPADAAPITWSSSVFVNEDSVSGSGLKDLMGTSSQFDTLGTQILASNGEGSAGLFDGITYTSIEVLPGTTSSTDFHVSDAVNPVSSTLERRGSPETVTLGTGGVGTLVSGNAYRIQLLLMDGRGFSSVMGRTVAVDGVNQGVFANGDGGTTTWGDGRLVTGTFTADATSQDFTIEIFQGAVSAGSQLNALLLHDVTVDAMTLFVDRETGTMTLKNTSGADLTIFGYEIDSSIGALNPSTAAWNTISGHFDSNSNGGNGSVDGDDAWTVLPDTTAAFSNDLTEFAFGGAGQEGDGANLAANQEIDLGQGWFPSPNEDDLTLKFVDGNGNEIDAVVEYTGNSDVPLKRSDLDHDGDVDVNDWVIFNANDFSTEMDVNGFSEAMAYNMGDIDHDFDIDTTDFRLFRSDYEADNGLGSFALMVQSVPEPSSLLLLVLALPMLFVFSRRRKSLAPAYCSVLLVCILGSFIASSADAAPVAFDFVDGGVFDDGAPIGTTITLTDGGVFNPITITSIDAKAPEYTDDGNGGLAWNGTSYLTPGTTIHGANGLLINNPGISPAGDTTGFNEFESWTMTFDRDVVINELNFSSFSDSDGDQGSITVDTGTPVVFLATQATLVDGVDDKFDPFGSLVIPAGTDITFLGLDSNVVDGTSAWRLRGITVTEVPLDLSLRLKALVDLTSGEITLTNPGSETLELDSYELSSSDNSLKPTTGWNSLDNQGYDSIGAGQGQSWDEGGQASSSLIGERFLLGSTVLNPGESVSIGNAFDITGDLSNLSLFYSDPSQTGLFGVIAEDVSGGILIGDFNSDGTVDEVDLSYWETGYGTAANAQWSDGDSDDDGDVDGADFLAWQRAYGSSSDSQIGFTAVPEPGTYAIALIGVVMGLLCNRQNGRRCLP